MIQIAGVSSDVNILKNDCQHSSSDPTDCKFGASVDDGGEIDFVFWGDSHANALTPGVAASAESHQKNGIFTARSACPPIFAVGRLPTDRACVEYLEHVRSFLDEQKTIPLVILSARWALSVEGVRYPVDGKEKVRLTWIGSEEDRPKSSDNSDLFEAGLRHTLSELKQPGRRIVILGPTPEVAFDVPREFARAELLQRNLPRSLSTATHHQRTAKTEAILRRIAQSHPDVEYISLTEAFCDDTTCDLIGTDGLPLFTDDDHITATAARERLPSKLKDMWSPGN